MTELREASTWAYRHVDSLDVIAGAVGIEVAGKFGHEVENETYAALADFIDRPACSMEYMPEYSGDELYPTEAYRCSECGWIVSEGKPSYCPCCGAEVIDEDGAY